MQAAQTPLVEVIATEALDRRIPRVRSSAAEARAVSELKRALAGSPRAVLQRLVEVALDLCEAQSAGVSLLEESDGRHVFRWHGVAGEWSRMLWKTLPREFSPCGTVLDRQEPLLMIDPQRYFTSLGEIPPRVMEALLVPFAVRGETVGTVWVIAHDAERHFDREDRRVLSELTRFAGAAYGRLQSFKAEDIEELSRMHLALEPTPKPKSKPKSP